MGRWQLRATLRGYTNAVNSLAFSADGSLLAWAGGLGYDHTVVLWDQAGGRLLASLQCRETVTPTTIRCLAFSPDGRWLAAGGDGPVRIWSVREQKLLQELPWQAVFPSYVPSLSFAPDGAMLAACCHGGSSDMQTSDSVRTWTVATGRPGDVLVGSSGDWSQPRQRAGRRLVLARRPAAHPRDVRRIRIRTASPRGSVKVWSLEERSKSQSYRIPGGNVYAAHSSRTGELLVAVAAGESQFRQAFGPMPFPQGFVGRGPAGGFPPGAIPSLPLGQSVAESPDAGSSVPAVVSDPASVAVCGTAEARRGCSSTGHEGPSLPWSFPPTPSGWPRVARTIRSRSGPSPRWRGSRSSEATPTARPVGGNRGKPKTGCLGPLG